MAENSAIEWRDSTFNPWSAGGVNGLVTQLAEGDAVVDVEAQLRVRRERLDMVGVEIAAARVTAMPAGEPVATHHVEAPRATGWRLAKVLSRRVGQHDRNAGGLRVPITVDQEPPLCPDMKGVYRLATEEELDVGYRAAFPEGPQPIATFRLDNPDDIKRAKAVLSPAALNGFFGPGGNGMAAFSAALEEQSRG